MNTRPNATFIVVIFSLYQILFWEASFLEICKYDWSDFLTEYFEQETTYIFQQETIIKEILAQKEQLEILAQDYLTKPLAQSLPLFQAFVIFMLFDLKDETQIPTYLKLAKDLLGASTAKTIHTIAKKHTNKNFKNNP
jgi:hypothetical protein